MSAMLKVIANAVHSGGHCYIAPAPAGGDDMTQTASKLRLFEDGAEIGPAHSMHADIADMGEGRFSHWGEAIYFSSSDGTSPIDNGRQYMALFDQEAAKPSRTILQKDTFLAIQSGVLRYPYKDVRCLKSPLDMALYNILLWREKPKTILELGTLDGGSAVWFADMMKLFGIDGHVHSLDIATPPKIEHPAITLYQGDIFDIGATWSKEWIASLPRPILAIDDAGHHYQMSKSAIAFMADVLHPGEYLVVEDGIATPVGEDEQYDGGPLRAIDEFIASRKEFEVDRFYCDFYGMNGTWATEGFLKRV